MKITKNDNTEHDYNYVVRFGKHAPTLEIIDLKKNNTLKLSLTRKEVEFLFIGLQKQERGTNYP